MASAVISQFSDISFLQGISFEMLDELYAQRTKPRHFKEKAQELRAERAEPTVHVGKDVEAAVRTERS
jgi:hypothetical protein